MNKMSMKKMIAAGTMVGLIGGLTNAALAADVVGQEPALPNDVMMEPAPLNTWSGPYAGVTLGYGTGDSDTAVGSVDTDGVVGSGFAGYQAQTGGFVFGGEADIGYNGMEGNLVGTTVEHGIDGSLRARMGVAVTDNVLLYGTAGGAAGRVEVSDAAGSDTQTLLGWTAGAGVDAMFTNQIFGRAEYRYTDLGDEQFNTGSGIQNVDSTTNKFQLGLGVKF